MKTLRALSCMSPSAPAVSISILESPGKWSRCRRPQLAIDILVENDSYCSRAERGCFESSGCRASVASRRLATLHQTASIYDQGSLDIDSLLTMPATFRVGLGLRSAFSYVLWLARTCRKVTSMICLALGHSQSAFAISIHGVCAFSTPSLCVSMPMPYRKETSHHHCMRFQPYPIEIPQNQSPPFNTGCVNPSPRHLLFEPPTPRGNRCIRHQHFFLFFLLFISFPRSPFLHHQTAYPTHFISPSIPPSLPIPSTAHSPQPTPPASPHSPLLSPPSPSIKFRYRPFQTSSPSPSLLLFLQLLHAQRWTHSRTPNTVSTPTTTSKHKLSPTSNFRVLDNVRSIQRRHRPYELAHHHHSFK